jgi:hypothetical protein
MTTDLLSQIPELQREAEDYERKARALRQIIASIRTLNGHASEVLNPTFVEQNGKVFVAQPADPAGPRGRRAVLRLMAEDPNRDWKVVELKTELLRRGWAPTPKAVEASVKRLRREGDLQSPRYGYYKLARAAGEEVGADTGVQTS